MTIKSSATSEDTTESRKISRDRGDSNTQDALMGVPDFTGESTDSIERKPNKRSARHIPKYHDLHEDLLLVNRQILINISTFEILQEGVGAAGMFFLSGAFWLLASILVEHSNKLSQFAPWIMFCLACIIFGAILAYVAYIHFSKKRDVLNDVIQGATHLEAKDDA